MTTTTRVEPAPFTMGRLSWDRYFLIIADAVALRASCSRRQIGAVLVRNHRTIATGYNGAPAGEPHCIDGACPRGRLSYDEVPAYSDYSYGPGWCIAVHAEVNCLSDATDRGFDAFGESTLYITAPPCDGCQTFIGYKHLQRLVWRDQDRICEMNLT